MTASFDFTGMDDATLTWLLDVFYARPIAAGVLIAPNGNSIHDMDRDARNELRRRRVEAFRDQHGAPPEDHWDDDLRMMFAVQYPEARA